MRAPLPYYVWETNTHGGFATLLGLENVEDTFELLRGVPRAETWPSDAAFRMNPAFPRDVKLADAVRNREGVAVASARLRDVLAGFAPADTEFLPVTILNHKGRVAADDYAVVNPYRVVDALDAGTTGLIWNAIDPDLVAGCFGLVLDPARLDPDAVLFRLRHLPTEVFVREDAVRAAEAAGLAGLRFTPADAFEL